MKHDPMQQYLAALANVQAQEVARIDVVRAMGAVPVAVGADIQPAPARGGVVVFDFVKGYPRGDDGFDWKPAGHAGRRSMRVADAFDKMIAAALRRRSRLALSEAQIGMGRLYASLVERHEAGAVRCSSVEGRVSGGTGDVDGFTQARIDASRRIDMLRRRIGTGVAMELRRVRPSKSGGAQRQAITDRVLVDSVCLGGQTVSEVLKRHGWAVKGETVKQATAALSACLERMIGPKVVRGVHVMRAD